MTGRWEPLLAHRQATRQAEAQTPRSLARARQNDFGHTELWQNSVLGEGRCRSSARRSRRRVYIYAVVRGGSAAMHACGGS